MDQNFPKILAVQVVLTNDEGEVLLIPRPKEPEMGKWEVAAGYVNPGERLVEAVQRHVQKDTGIKEIKDIKFTGKYYDDPDRHPGTFCIPFIFTAKVADSSSQSIGKWFKKEELKDLEYAFGDDKTLEDLGLK